MPHFTVRRTLLLFLSGLTCLALLFGVGGGHLTRSAGPDNAYALKAPSFLGVAYAQGAAPEAAPASIFDGEAGIAAYFQSPSAINLATVKPLYRTIETQTAQYIIGSMAVPEYPESEDVHLYIHTNGWVMAYYLKADPVGKIFDWRSYTGGTTIPTKIERILGLVVAQIGIVQQPMTFYHFQYPNATHMMLIADQAVDSTDSFDVNLTSSFAFSERSWAMGTHQVAATYNLDGNQIKQLPAPGSGNWATAQGLLSPTQLTLDVFHVIGIAPADTWAIDTADAGLALIYRVP
jgi:hypothetical protein